MKGFLKVGFLLSAICLISMTATSYPVSKEVKTSVHDVGWCPGSDIVTYFQENGNYYISSEKVYVDISHYMQVNERVIIAEAVIPAAYRYQRKRFASFNSKLNQAHIQLYGIDKARSEQSCYSVFTAGVISWDEYKDSLYWLWASKTKLDS